MFCPLLESDEVVLTCLPPLEKISAEAHVHKKLLSRDQVEAYFIDRGRYSHQCGGAVRSGNEVFVFDACRMNEPVFISRHHCAEGLQHMTVDASTPGRYLV